MAEDTVTAGELRAFLADVPDDLSVNVQACGAVGDARSVSRNADGVLIAE